MPTPLLKIRNLLFKYAFSFLCLFVFDTVFSQPLDFKSCNNSFTTEDRELCLESGFELYFNYLAIHNAEKLELTEGEEELVHFEIVVDSLGAFHIKDLYQINDKMLDMVSFMLNKIGAIGKYTVNNEAVETSFEFKNFYIIDERKQVSYKNFNETSYNLIPMPYDLADSPPEHKDCTNGDKNYKIRCIRLAIRSLLFNQFDMGVFSEAGVSIGYEEISYSFIINTKGEITNIKSSASHHLLEEEIIRTISMLPAFKPAIKNNNPIAVSFKQRIRFEVTKNMLRKKRKKGK